MDFEITDGILTWVNAPRSHLVIPEGVREIGEGVLTRCSALCRVTFPTSLERIGERAFEGCENLEVLELPEGVKSVDLLAFSGCERLKHIYISKTVESIEGNVFDGCACDGRQSDYCICLYGPKCRGNRDKNRSRNER